MISLIEAQNARTKETRIFIKTLKKQGLLYFAPILHYKHACVCCLAQNHHVWELLPDQMKYNCTWARIAFDLEHDVTIYIFDN